MLEARNLSGSGLELAVELLDQGLTVLVTLLERGEKGFAGDSGLYSGHCEP